MRSHSRTAQLQPSMHVSPFFDQFLLTSYLTHEKRVVLCVHSLKLCLTGQNCSGTSTRRDKANVTQTANQHTRVRFGVYEADLKTGELRKSGTRIRIQSQPFKVLTLLLENAGEVVTREQLQQELWGSDTIVDFDHSLGTAINKIREALGDSADNPRFIETLAKRGYRFIAPTSFGPNGYEAPSSSVFAQSGNPSSTANADLTTQSPGAAHAPGSALSETAVPVTSGTLQPRSLIIKRLSASSVRTRSGVAVGALLLIASAIYVSGPLREQAFPAPAKVTQITFSGRISPGEPQLESLPATATDGSRIYFSEIEGGRTVLSQASIGDGETSALGVPSEIEAPSLGDISPDGSKLLVRSHLAPEAEQALWIVPTHGGTARRIANILAHDASWLPDGRHIIYAAGNDLFVTREDGTENSKFASLQGRAFWLRWSSDGKRLRFTLLNSLNHTTSLWESSEDGRNVHPLLTGGNTATDECCGSWTEDGRYFVFQSAENGVSNIWALQETSYLPGTKSATLRQITNGPLSYQAPITARTGHTIFFIGMEARFQLLRFDPSSSHFILYEKGWGLAGRTEYSRDGKWVAWIKPSDGSLWRSRADGSERLQLTAPPLQVFMMHWSPDNQQLALMCRESGKPWKIYLIGAAGGGWQHLLDENRNEADPDWSPDGKKIVFGRLPELMAREAQSKSIQILDLSSRQISTIPSSEGLFSPRWSPDGRYIAAMSLDQRKLVLFDTSNNKWNKLVSRSAADPVWSHDGRWIYFHDFMEDGQPIYRVSIPDGRLEHVAGMGNLDSSDVVDYRFSGLAPGDVPLVRARVWTANVYSLDLDRK